MNRRLPALLAAVILVSCACSASGPSPAAAGVELAVAHVPRAAVPHADPSIAAGGMTAFGLSLFRALAAEPGNLVFSPASIELALAMARAGAQGRTASQMDVVMHDVGANATADSINALDAALASRTGTFTDAEGHALPVTLRIANAPFAQAGMPIEPTYLDALASRFGAGLRLVDYERAPDVARGLINAWVSDTTNGKIAQLLAPGTIDEMTRLVLVNAIYLKAPWATPFAAERTVPGPFTRSDGTTVQVSMMAATEGYRYASGVGWRAVELPYLGDQLALDVILPDDFASFEQALDPQVLARITTSMENQEVELSLPRFGATTQTDLATVLAALGMPLAFDPDHADFSGITSAERLFIARVVHEATITVDEKGTEAAAATAVAMAASAMPAEPVVLRVDHPFLFALRDRPTGAVLFLGRIVDPSA
jgi:serine protease inhibitor